MKSTPDTRPKAAFICEGRTGERLRLRTFPIADAAARAAARAACEERAVAYPDGATVRELALDKGQGSGAVSPTLKEEADF